MEARKGLKNLSVVNRVGVQVPSGLSAPVPEWNMDMAKDHGFVGSNPTRSIYRHVAQRKTRCVQGTVSVGSNPTMSIYGRLPQRKTGPAQTRLFEGSNPSPSTLVFCFGHLSFVFYLPRVRIIKEGKVVTHRR